MSISLPHISRVILSGSIGFICGVAFISFFSVSVEAGLFCVIICVIGSFAIFYKSSSVWIVIVGVLLFGVGVLIMNNSLVNIAKKDSIVGTVFIGEAIVSEDIVQKSWTSQVTLRYKDLVRSEESFAVIGWRPKNNITVIIKDEKYTSVQRDDILLLECTSSLPQNYNDFDYRKYLAMHGVDYVCEDFSYDIVGHETTMLGNLSQIRVYMEKIVNTTIPAPQSALANGLLFGNIIFGF